MTPTEIKALRTTRAGETKMNRLKDPAEYDCLVFLDFDGVLNGHEFDELALSNRLDYDKIKHLNTILDATGAGLVVSSAWRYLVHRGDMSLDGLDWLLRSHGVRSGHLCGITRPDSTLAGYPASDERGSQVEDFLLKHVPHKIIRHVVIDDLDLGITAAGHPFVQTDGKIGLSDAHATQAITHLSHS